MELLQIIAEAFDVYETEYLANFTNLGDELQVTNYEGQSLEVELGDNDSIIIFAEKRSPEIAADMIATHIGMLDNERNEVKTYLKDLLSESVE